MSRGLNFVMLKGHDRIPNTQRCFISMISENEMPTIYFVFD